MKTVIVDERIDFECESALAQKGFGIIKLPACPILQKPVSAHPDMLVFIGKGKLLCHEKYYNIAKKEIDGITSAGKLDLVISYEDLRSEYPFDVLFNAATVGDKLICNVCSASKHLIDLYGEENVINVKQGYAKCSTCTVGDNGIITADPSIAKAASAAGIDTLVLSGSTTRLDGYDTGFIGGASGDDGEHIFFTGKVEAHPEFEKIREFCRKNGREAVSLSDALLYDYGSLMFL